MKRVAPLCALALCLGLPVSAERPVTIDNVKIEVRTNTVGRYKGSEYLRVSFLATPNESVRPRHTVFVKGVCHVGGRRMTDDIHALGGRLEALGTGETKELSVPLFMSAGLDDAPSQCDLTFRLTKSVDKYGPALGDFCWSGGRLARAGSCE
jgi:hypothetical protein